MNWRIRVYLKTLLCSLLCIAPFTSKAYSAPHKHTECNNEDCITFPSDAGYINVHDFGARGNGITDDTKAINDALAASGSDTGAQFWQDKIVYFPDGIYLVSAPLMKRYANGKDASGAILIGQSRAHTVIRLRDHAKGYDNAQQPRAIVFTTSKLLGSDATGGGKDYASKGEGNDAYANFIENLTIDAGRDNPGAIGIDYLANNYGAVRHVRLQAENDSGSTGIALLRKWPGPALIEDVSIEGFDVGIDADNTEYGMTLENITLSGQRSIGLRNAHNMLAIHNLNIQEAPSPVVNSAMDGLVVIEGGTINHLQPIEREALANVGYLNLRDLKVSGYSAVLGEEVTTAETLDGIYQANNHQSGSKKPWSIAVSMPPATFIEPVQKWVSIASYGAKPDMQVDSTDAVRLAFASGAHTVYFPHGTYYISDNIVIPPSVWRIVGMMSALHPYKNRSLSFRRDEGMLRAKNDDKPLAIEKLTFDNSNLGNQVALEAIGNKPLVLRDIVGAGVITLKRPAFAGEAFIDNTCCGPLDLAGKKGAWARQLDIESGDIGIENIGSPLWVLGLKTEGERIVMESKQDARSEILGGLLYMVSPASGGKIPAFRSIDSKVYASYVEEAFNPKAVYAIHLEDSNHGKTHQVRAESLPKRNVARMVPQLAN